MGDQRLFTVREAEATLPLLRRIVSDVLAGHRRWKALVAEYELLAAPLTAGGDEPEAVRAAREAADDEAHRINAWLQELSEIGCLFKGFEAGLVDFYALREDRLVFLCWKLDEEHIGYWHEVDSGYDGRHPLDSLMLAEPVTG
jgi:hypothetical protein